NPQIRNAGGAVPCHAAPSVAWTFRVSPSSGWLTRLRRMGMSNGSHEITFEFEAPGEVEDLQLLVLDLREVGGLSASISQRGSTPPPGAKGWQQDYALVVMASAPVLSAVAAITRSWLQRSSRRKLVLQVDGQRMELTALSAKSESELVEQLLRHATA